MSAPGALKPPFTYFGGKLSLAERIIPLLPAHEHYVEPFFGSGAVLLAKPPARAETVNDLSGDLVNFWQVLRDRPDDLERACALTPHARAEHQLAYEPAGDPLERARRTWVRLTQGRAGQLYQRTGWRFRLKPDGSPSMPAYLAAYVSRLHPAARCMSGVSIECRPALEVIAAYGQHKGCLIYADPPYLDSVRSHDKHGNVYVHEMRTETDHRELADALLEARAAVGLSGYHSPLYDELYAGWHQREISVFNGNGTGDRSRTEVLWSNRPFRQGSLFDDPEAS